MENKLRTGGYSVYLCIDTEIQDILEDTLANWDDYPRTRNPSDAVYRARNADGTYTEIPQPQVGAAILDYRTGELKAIAGGRYAPTQRKTLNRASDINMPVGSAIKPISVYAPAVDLGGSPASIVYNMPVPIKGWTVDGKDSFPQNYGGGGYKGPETFREALRQSHNTAAAQALMTYVGVERSAQYLRLMGVDDKNIIEGGFGLALGSSGLTPIQMAVAFGTLANKGVYLEPLSFSKIIDSNGNVIVDAHAIQEKRQVFKASTAYLVVDMLKGVVFQRHGLQGQDLLAGGRRQDRHQLRCARRNLCRHDRLVFRRAVDRARQLSAPYLQGDGRQRRRAIVAVLHGKDPQSKGARLARDHRRRAGGLRPGQGDDLRRQRPAGDRRLPPRHQRLQHDHRLLGSGQRAYAVLLHAFGAAHLHRVRPPGDGVLPVECRGKPGHRRHSAGPPALRLH